ncbi:unnamed protein product [Bursaphelenchus xylophilus]|uniref:(pine wood nematode) hypothetical protein n=1 Tax=Bursaphelenchus xylophilus TaxID=6326 RepID=A0A1I7SMC6_BURXY|nr:unnamed protein product [Bursaphelenchus xylophilus]CAG9130113.1 unnamed protein product [Bursaphelenchus xylophilus]
MAATIHEYSAVELPAQTQVTVKMCKLRLHSSGVFSNVYRGTLVEPLPRREIAVKKTWPDPGQDGHKNYEVIMLLELSKEKHLNIVQVLFSFKTKAPDGRICESMIFDFMPATLHSQIKSLGPPHLNIVDIKIYTWQLFNGLYYLMKKRICHRDIKPQNILIDPDQGILKIGDFGSAKVMKPNVESTAYQVTRFYRPPELLLDAVFYSPLVDVWSAGCVFGEMLRGHVLLPGRDSKHQLRLVIEALGSPDAGELLAMRSCTRLDGGIVQPRGFNHLLNCPRENIEFLAKILVYNPKQRHHGAALLTDPYFNELFAANKKRQNGKFVADIPSFKDMIEFGPKHSQKTKHRKSLKSTSADATNQSGEVSDNAASMIRGSKEDDKKRGLLGRRKKSKEELEAGGSREQIRTSKSYQDVRRSK